MIRKIIILCSIFLLLNSSVYSQIGIGLEFPREVFPKYNFSSLRATNFYGDPNNVILNYGGKNDISIFYFNTPSQSSPTFDNAVKHLKSQVEINELDSLYNILVSKSNDSLALIGLSNEYLELFRQKANIDIPLALNYLEKSIKLISQKSYFEFDLLIRYSYLARKYSELGYQDSGNYYINLCMNYLPKVCNYKKEDSYRIYYNLAITMQNINNIDKAIEYDSIALEYVNSYLSVYHLARVDVLFTMAILMDIKKDYSKSIEFNNQALKIISMHPLSDTFQYKAAILFNIGYENVRLGNMNRALDFYKQSYKLAQEIKYDNLMDHLNCNIGEVYESLFRFDSSLVYLEKVRNEFKIKTPIVFYWQGLNNYYQKNYSESKKQFNEAILFQTKLNDTNSHDWLISNCHLYLSLIMGIENKMSDYIKHLELSIQYSEDTLFKSSNYLKIGDAFMNQGKFENALLYYDSASSIVGNSNNDYYSNFLIHSNKLVIFQKLNKKIKYNYELNKCYDIIAKYNELNQIKFYAFSRAIGNFYMQINNNDSALIYFKNCLQQIYEKDSINLFEVNFIISDIYRIQNKHRDSKQFLDKTLTYLCSGIDSNVICNLYFTLGLNSFSQNDLTKAKKYLNNYFQIHTLTNLNSLQNIFARYLIFTISIIESDTNQSLISSTEIINCYFSNKLYLDSNITPTLIYSMAYNYQNMYSNDVQKITENLESTFNNPLYIKAHENLNQMKYAYCYFLLDFLQKFNKPLIEKKIYDQVCNLIDKNFLLFKDTLTLKYGYYNLVQFHTSKNNVDSIYHYYCKIFKLLDQKKDVREHSYVLWNLARIQYYNFNEKKVAIRRLESVIREFENSNTYDFQLQSSLYREMAYFKLNMNSYKEANDYFSKSINSDPKYNYMDYFERVFCLMNYTDSSISISELFNVRQRLLNAFDNNSKNFTLEIRSYFNYYYKKLFYYYLDLKKCYLAADILKYSNTWIDNNLKKVMELHLSSQCAPNLSFVIIEQLIDENIYSIDSIKNDKYLVSIINSDKMKTIFEKYNLTEYGY